MGRDIKTQFLASENTLLVDIHLAGSRTVLCHRILASEISLLVDIVLVGLEANSIETAKKPSTNKMISLAKKPERLH